MRLIYGIILGIILIAVFIIFYKKEKDIFSPMCVFSFIQFLNYVPNIIFKDIEHYTKLTVENTFIVLVYETIFVLFVIFGYCLKNKKVENNYLNFNETKEYKSYSTTIWITFLIGLSAKIYVIQKLGGFFYVFNNMSYSYSTQSSGYGYINYLAKLMLVAILLMFDKVINSNKLKNKVILLFMVLIYMSSYFIYSSRGPALELILILVFCINYLKKKFKIRNLFKIRVLILVGIIALISVVLVNFRENYSGQTLNMNLKDKLNNVGEDFLDEFSKVGRDAFTYEEFNTDNLWYGKIYTNIITGFIPSKLYYNKPPIDDGLYLVNLMLGKNVEPNQGRLDLYYMYGSVPFSSQGLLFANFGVLGLIFGGIVTGVLFRRAYAIMNKRCNVFTVSNYFYFVYMFGFTPLRIINTIQYILIFWLFEKILYKLKIKIIINKKNKIECRGNI